MDLPEYISCVTTGKEAKKLVDHLLCSERPLCLPIVFKRAGVTESKVSLFAIAMHSDYYIFDLRDAPNVLISSGLFRLLSSPSFLKLTHDGSDDLQELIKYRFSVNSIFDTHRAFDRVAVWNRMPTRKISLAALHQKLNAITCELDIEEAELQAAIRCPVFVDRTGMDWGQRPVKTAMLIQLAAEVAALRQCYFGLCCIGRCFNNLETLRRVDRVGEAREKSPEQENAYKVALCAGIRTHLLSLGESVLNGTKSVAEFRLIPYYMRH